MKNTTFINDYDYVKQLIEKNDVRAIFHTINYQCISKHEIEYSEIATIIFDLIIKHGEGVAVDICKRVKLQDIALTEKQRWCIAFAFQKITVQQVADFQKDEEALIESETEKAVETTDPVPAEPLAASDIRTVRDFQESGRIFIHLHDGRTIPRMFTSQEIRELQTIQKSQGVVAFHEAVARMFNEKYRTPQHLTYVKLSPSDERYFEKVFFARTTGIWPEE